MNFISILNKFSCCKLFWAVCLLFYGGLIVITAIVTGTTLPQQLPFTVMNSSAHALRKPDIIELRVLRVYEVNKSAPVTYYRSVVHVESGRTVDLPGQHTVLEKGEHISSCIFILPGSIPSGKYIFRTTVTWTPTWSLVPHSKVLVDTTFTVCEKFEQCN